MKTGNLFVEVCIVALLFLAAPSAASDPVGDNGVADLTWAPINPEIGQWVAYQIAGIPAGDIDRSEWDFGEPGCDGFEQNQVCDSPFSDCLQAAFKYASSGDKDVFVVVKDATTGSTIGSAMARVNVETAGSCGGVADDLFVVYSFYAAGAAGSEWVHELALSNPGWRDESFTLDWLPRDQNNATPPLSEIYTVPAGTTVRVENVLDEVFGLASGVVGSLRLSPRPQVTRLSSLGLNTNGSSSYGNFIPHVPPIDGLDMGDTGHLIGLTEDDDLRTNISCMNMSDEVVQIDLNLHTSDGTWLDLVTVFLQPLSSHQLNQVFAAFAPVDGYIEVSHSQPQTQITCTGMVVTNSANDGRIVTLGKTPSTAETLILPRAVHDAAATTDLAVFAPSGAAEVTIDYLLSDQDNSGLLNWIVVPVADQQVVRLPSIMDIAGFSGTAALRIHMTTGLVEVSAAESQRPVGTGLHRSARVLPLADLAPPHRPASIIHLREGADHRTDIGAVNPTTVDLTMIVDLYQADGTSLGGMTFQVPPLSHHQENGVFTAIGHPVVDDGYAWVRTTTPGGAFFAYGLVTELNTGDSFEHEAELLPESVFSDGFDDGDSLGWTETVSGL